MKNIFAITIIFVLAISGCSRYKTEFNSPITIEKNAPQERFRIALAREYNIISERASIRKDYTNSTYFRRKARDVSSIESFVFDVLPEKPQDWNIKNDVVLDKMYDARIELLEKLENKKLVDAAPTSAAKALAFYDCWIKQTKDAQTKAKPSDDVNCGEDYAKITAYLNEVETEIAQKNNKKFLGKLFAEDRVFEDGTNSEDRMFSTKYQGRSKYAGSYRDGKYDAISDKQTREDKKIADAEAAAKAKAEKLAKARAAAKKAEKEAAANNKSGSTKSGDSASGQNFIVDESGDGADVAYIVYFEKGADKIKPTSEKELEKALAEIKTASPKRISINGHTDKQTEDNQSLILSKKRADNVRDLIAAKGVDKNILRTFGFGKSDNSSTSADGQNRVEITFKGK
jgi:outer membrane protein OmpA-like peptidoglycan-associated protein